MHKLQVQQSYRKDSERVIHDSWLNSSPIEVTNSEYNTTTFQIESVHRKAMNQSFRICFDYYKKYSHRKYYEKEEFQKVIMECKVDSKNIQSNSKENKRCAYDNSTNQMKLTIDDTKESTIVDALYTVKVDLICRIHYDWRFESCSQCKFTFNQPVILRRIQKSATISAKNAMVPIAIVLLILTLTTSIIVYYKKKTRCDQARLVSSTPSPTMLWEDNPNYSSNDSLDAVDGAHLFPDWLRNHMDIIYDPECIKKEKKLGQGHYGAVFEGKIWLANAVYV